MWEVVAHGGSTVFYLKAPEVSSLISTLQLSCNIQRIMSKLAPSTAQ